MSADQRRNPESFPADDKGVYDAYVAGRMSAAMAVGVHVGLFDALDTEPMQEAELAQRFGFRARGVRSLLVALSSMGLVERRGDLLHLTADASSFLVRGKPGSLSGLVDLEMDHFLSPASLLQALKTGTTSAYGDADPWQTHEADPNTARSFTAAMHSVSERPAAGLAEVAPLADVRRLLDVGGGSGALSLAAARAHPELCCTVWDLPVVCELAREYAQRAELTERVGASPGDMFREPFPEGYDAILLSQILHDWPFERGAELMAKAFAALPPGGHILIHEKLVEEDGGPLANALVNLDMLVWTEGQQYRESELREMLEAIGFEGVQRRATAGYWSVVWGRKP